MNVARPTKRMRIAFALPNLAPDGGAERVLLSVIRHLDRSRFEPILIVLHIGPNDLSDFVSDEIEIVSLNTHRVRYAPIPLARAIKHLNPDVLFSGLGHLNLMIAIMRSILPRRLAIIARETSVVSEFNRELNLSWIRNALYRRFYASLDHVICQSQDMFTDLTQNLGFPIDRASIIFNPVDIHRIRRRAQSPVPPNVQYWPVSEPNPDQVGAKNPLRLVAVGRLQPQKGFDILLDAISLLTPGSVQLAIVGQGHLMTDLQEQATSLGISQWVSFHGYVANPYPIMKAADALVLSSRYEGLPNVVLEALACETPVIATPCPGGLTQIAQLTGGVTLSSSIDAKGLANAIEQFSQSKGNDHAIDVSAFAIDEIVVAYQALIDHVIRIKSDI